MSETARKYVVWQGKLYDRMRPMPWDPDHGHEAVCLGDAPAALAQQDSAFYPEGGPGLVVPGQDGMAIHWVEADLQAVTLQPGDTLVLMYPFVLPTDYREGLQRWMGNNFPGHKVLVLEEGMRLGVLRAADGNI